MRFEFDEEHYEFAAVVGDALTRHAGARLVRGLWEGSADGSSLVDALVELGVTGLTVPSEHGGAGLAVSDCILVLEQLGTHLVPHPVAEGFAVVAPLLLRHADDGVSGRLLAGIASGELTATVQDGWSGWAPWARSADVVAVVLDDAVVLTTPKSEHVEVLDGVDASRRLGRVSASAPHIEILGPSAGSEARQRATIMTSSLLVGVAFGMVDAAVDYAKVRNQFGRPIGSFQAVKHLLANAFTAVEASRRTAWWASLAVDADAPDANEAVSVAKATIGEAAEQASNAALQVHGGIGYTWECDLQLWMKRTQALQGSWGNADEHLGALERIYAEARDDVGSDHGRAVAQGASGQRTEGALPSTPAAAAAGTSS